MSAGYLRISHESTPGNQSNTPTLSTKKVFMPVISYDPDPGVEHMIREDELVGTNEPRPALAEGYVPSYSLNVRAYPDVMGMLLTCQLGAPTTTAGNGSITDPDSVAIPVGAYRHVWTAPFGPSGSYPMTAQHDIAYADQSVYYKAKGAATETLTLATPTRGGANATAAGPVLYFTRQSDPSLSPAYEAETLKPFERVHAGLSWKSGGASAEDFTLTITNGTDPIQTYGGGSRWRDQVFKADAPVTVTGSIQTTALDVDDYDELEAPTGFAATAKWIHDTAIASSYPYKLFVVFNLAQYVGGGPGTLEARRRIGGTFDFRGARSSSSSVTITLVNATTSYA